MCFAVIFPRNPPFPKTIRSGFVLTTFLLKYPPLHMMNARLHLLCSLPGMAVDSNYIYRSNDIHLGTSIINIVLSYRVVEMSSTV